MRDALTIAGQSTRYGIAGAVVVSLGVHALAGGGAYLFAEPPAPRVAPKAPVVVDVRLVATRPRVERPAPQQASVHTAAASAPSTTACAPVAAVAPAVAPAGPPVSAPEGSARARKRTRGPKAVAGAGSMPTTLAEDTSSPGPIAPAEPAPSAPPATPAPAPSARDAAQVHATAVAAWMTTVVRSVEAFRRYPRRAARQGAEGTARVVVVVDAAGRFVEPLRVSASSGSEDLDAMALRMVSAASPLPRPPISPGEDRLRVVLPIRFRLHGSEP